MIKYRDEFIDNLDLILEEVQNTMISVAQQELMKGVSNPSLYVFTQRNNTNNLTKKLISIGTQYNKIIEQVTKEEAVKIFKEEKGIPGDKVKKQAQQFVDKNKQELQMQMSLLISGVLKQQSLMIEKISESQIIEMAKPQETIIGGMKETQKLFNTITETVEKYGGVDKVPSQRIGDRNYSYKTYIEQTTSVGVKQEQLGLMVDSTKDMGQVFLICDTFGNSAIDHAEYQGKIYVLDDWRNYIHDEELANRIQDYIDSNNILTVKQVTEGEPYLTTRPHCRHRLHMITNDEVLGDIKPKEYLKNNKLDFQGEYDPKKAEITAEQRYNERMIRKWKQKELNSKQLEQNANKNIDTNKNRAIIKSNQEKVREWQSKQRTLINDNKYLERDYRRESIKDITYDLGYKRNKYLNSK